MNYYYLISSLPNLDPDDVSLSPDLLEDIVASIRENLTPEDQAVLQCLFHENDNRNFLFILFREYHDFEIRTFSKPISIPTKVLENYRREYSSLPDYMMNYLNEHSGSFSSLTMREMEQSLNQYFLDYLASLDSFFLNSYFTWDQQLKHTLAEINRRSFDFLETISESKIPHFARVKTLHDLPDQKEISIRIQSDIDLKDIEALERNINRFYWQFADNWQFPRFSAESVFAYVVKLIRLYRLYGITTNGEPENTDFEELVMEIKENRSSPKMPLL